jgi:hypothetical protein
VQVLHLYGVQNLHFIEMQNLQAGALDEKNAFRAGGRKCIPAKRQILLSGERENIASRPEGKICIHA